VKPKVVITVNDNNGSFHWLVKNYKKARFFTIQNGHRTKWEMDTPRKHHHQYFFCFGDYDKDRYVKLGHVVDKYYPVGSLLTGHYISKFKKEGKNKYDLGIVSQYTPPKGFKIYSDSQVKELVAPQELVRHQKICRLRLNALELMNLFLVRYVEEYNLKAAVLMRNPLNCDEERKYYEEKYSGKAVLFGRNVEKMTSYLVADECELVVGFNSTFLAEAFGLGRKVVRIDFSGGDLWNDYDPMVMFTEPDYALFKKRLNELRAEPYDGYRKRTREYATYLMNNAPNRPTHIFIRQKVLKYL